MRGQAQSRIGGNAAALAQDLADAIGRNVEGIGELMRAEFEGLQKFFAEYFAGMSADAAHFLTSMVVRDFNVCGPAFGPSKAHAPFVIYPDAVLTLPIALQRL